MDTEEVVMDNINLSIAQQLYGKLLDGSDKHSNASSLAADRTLESMDRYLKKAGMGREALDPTKQLDEINQGIESVRKAAALTHARKVYEQMLKGFSTGSNTVKFRAPAGATDSVTLMDYELTVAGVGREALSPGIPVADINRSIEEILSNHPRTGEGSILGITAQDWVRARAGVAAGR
ncbi:MAG: hypothetical protein EYC62_07605 [Alphaproteobacteria bacterium]|nr:MAG: hypothetical protein EYC62_07605 [Alphaproteobacteria bacterium]